MNTGHLIAVMAGGALGAGGRYLVGVAVMRVLGPGFPWATVAVNVVGSVLMGLVVEMAARRTGLSPTALLFLTAGVLGGFTTFSAFSLDVVSLVQRGETGVAAGYVALNVGLGVAGLLAGLWLGRQVF